MMLLNTILALLGGIAVLAIPTVMTRLSGGGAVAKFLEQSIYLALFGQALLVFNYISIPVSIVLALYPTLLRVFAYGWVKFMNKRVTSGVYGDEAMWAAELVQDGDEEFIQAADVLSQQELRELGIIADSKSELRDKTVERALDQVEDELEIDINRNS